MTYLEFWHNSIEDSVKLIPIDLQIRNKLIKQCIDLSYKDIYNVSAWAYAHKDNIGYDKVFNDYTFIIVKI